jgi:hypothetical protein
MKEDVKIGDINEIDDDCECFEELQIIDSHGCILFLIASIIAGIAISITFYSLLK